MPHNQRLHITVRDSQTGRTVTLERRVTGPLRMISTPVATDADPTERSRVLDPTAKGGQPDAAHS